jgi:signal transduction histidine kinase
MRLSDFILHDMEPILAEWEAFAATLLPAAAGLSPSDLRDDAQRILEAVAKDLNTAQTRAEQSAKSRGLAIAVEGAPETATQTHAILRARDGFNINQLVAEYRALRASVQRLWAANAPLDHASLEDMIRFNEAIDQAITESVAHYHRTVQHSRNLLLGMLGHDMRTPLNAIMMTASYLASLSTEREIATAKDRLVRGGASIQALLDDLTDFNRTNFGLKLKVVPSEVELVQAASDELDQLRAAHPGRRIELFSTGNTHGRWDGARVQQVLRNLVTNAIRHGSPDTPIRVLLRGEQPDLRVEVSNNGHIDPSEFQQIFESFAKRTAEGAGLVAHEGLGLGLYIVSEIAKAHGGDVEARCEGEQTTFAVRLPRQPAAAGA